MEVSFAEAYPHLVPDFHPRNKPFTAGSIKSTHRLPLWWRCRSNKKHVYKCTITERIHRLEFKNGNGCPRCSFFTEEMVIAWIREHYKSNISRERKFDWSGKSRFDIVLEDDKIIIEIDGLQHFIRKNIRWEAPSKTRARDVLKMKNAFAHGYSVIRLHQFDVIHDLIPWQSELREAIERSMASGGPTLSLIAKDWKCYSKHLSELQKS